MSFFLIIGNHCDFVNFYGSLTHNDKLLDVKLQCCSRADYYHREISVSNRHLPLRWFGDKYDPLMLTGHAHVMTCYSGT